MTMRALHVVTTAAVLGALLIAGLVWMTLERHGDYDQRGTTNHGVSSIPSHAPAHGAPTVDTAQSAVDSTPTRAQREGEETESVVESPTLTLPSRNAYSVAYVDTLLSSMQAGALTENQRRDHRFILNSPAIPREVKHKLWSTTRLLMAQGTLNPSQVLAP